MLRSSLTNAFVAVLHLTITTKSSSRSTTHTTLCVQGDHALISADGMTILISDKLKRHLCFNSSNDR